LKVAAVTAAAAAAAASAAAAAAKPAEKEKSKEKPFVLIQQTLLQYCVLPRLLLTEEDAIYCAKFTLLLHSSECPAFSSLQCFDRIVKTVVPTVFCVTEREATNLGLFLYAFLEPLVKWLGSRKIYQVSQEEEKEMSLE
jgi:hypothetical protein